MFVCFLVQYLIMNMCISGFPKCLIGMFVDCYSLKKGTFLTDLLIFLGQLCPNSYIIKIIVLSYRLC